MILCVDIGNSTVYVGLMDVGCVVDSTHIARDAQAYIDNLKVFMGERQVEAVAVSSVVPLETTAMIDATRRLTGLSPLLVKRELKPMFPMVLDSPSTLGADRIADTTAAMRDYDLPLIVIDLGTATTFSVMDRQGVFLGGAICPGIVTSFRTLTDKAAQLKGYKLEVPTHVVATNTHGCIGSGIIVGHAAMIDGMVARIEEETHETYNVILTGGMASTVQPFCRRATHVDDTLILRGIYAMYEDYQAASKEV
ncbi:MAG: type III pantothenate kinase [Phocaeicola sp.]|uniref:type III pantothenate kinase n=1 Tax=Phocaeicola sp. TaxID=2773926 RepID=UPI003FA09A72